MPARQSVRKKYRKREKFNRQAQYHVHDRHVYAHGGFPPSEFSAQGQLVTPAQGLQAAEVVGRETGQGSAQRENIPEKHNGRGRGGHRPDAYQALLGQKDFMIGPLYKSLSKYADEAKKSAEMFKSEFSGKISIQGDVEIPYNVLTRVMYTCGQSGYPNMNLVVYRK